MISWQDNVILVTGGTGSFGKKFIKVMLDEFQPKKIIVFSRDELKQYEMQTSGYNQPNLRFFIGDVRDRDRLRRAMHGVDIVVHAAALKQVPACEYNPMEAIKTNIMGTSNVVEAALDAGVKKVLAISTDKAVNPVNLYGATKLAAEKLVIQSNAYAAGTATRYSCVRYGNVVGSRGSVVPVFLKQRQNGQVTITDERMTRFWLSLEQGVRFVIKCIEQMEGGEVFVPRIPSMKVTDLARAIAPDAQINVIGIRPGEKLHEVLISEDESRNTVEMENMFVVQPAEALWFGYSWQEKGKLLQDGFRYASDNNTEWLDIEGIQKYIAPFEKLFASGKLEG
ncbi:MAG: UDP-N-acetylglucosamine 4,6-dehydratase (inverting) [Chloroflexi bacterium GWB2_49_20]|nr:MAG: UDP-N-acetylglucosamine 4,6-dehydratase (inverting) [Chloroflexi bacterium GWB2_49_20]OGN80290.1 MAG: UDP-N-acetylglucosamine 4,6-dehydratase (inverting) [Chloroflexi bacterium GWC2_49_37]OGN86070.1 MAG: UDP-N-acetylglucosamine 4,6-dehydratase (inverting) [Chloroflexi bacterium GWD2_49_16]HCC79373.1 UDP-N-acetylglucosamine 4,6-dehydratase (inverting) [Anaerolineae bacterium]HCM96406.1 UDP-N-acetylglucosamine 4,6-dehydratase (inverting) [Anaerolineae bacterium]